MNLLQKSLEGISWVLKCTSVYFLETGNWPDFLQRQILLVLSLINQNKESCDCGFDFKTTFWESPIQDMTSQHAKSRRKKAIKGSHSWKCF